MTSYAEVAVGKLVIERPERARVFERHAIDYCCGGKATLAQACQERSIPLDQMEAELASSDATPAVTPPPPNEAVALIEHILATHHVFLQEAFGRISGLAEKVKRAHGERHPELDAVAITWERLRADLEPHLMKEEQVLFPWIRELKNSGGQIPGRPSVEAPIGMMEFEHTQAGELLAKLRQLTGDFTVPSDACPTFHAFYAALEEMERDTHEHIHKENNLLFPLALGLER
ncbi:MAG: iron-sulfur cluster repair di-iron protein [Candidatus Eisenbacteria bacterium]